MGDANWLRIMWHGFGGGAVNCARWGLSLGVVSYLYRALPSAWIGEFRSTVCVDWLDANGKGGILVMAKNVRHSFKRVFDVLARNPQWLVRVSPGPRRYRRFVGGYRRSADILK